MPFYLSYVVGRHGAAGSLRETLGHASLALTQHNPPKPPQVIATVGFWGSSQVRLERNLETSEEHRYFHKTYPITQEEMEKFLARVNADRRLQNNPEVEKHEDDDVDNSEPGGPAFSYVKFNCKTYALDVLRDVGIVDKNLQNNWLIDIPTRTSQLEPLVLNYGDEDEEENINNIGDWTSPLIVSPRIDANYLTNATSDEVDDMFVKIRQKEFAACLNDLTSLLQDNELQKMPEAAELKKNFSEIQQSLKQENLTNGDLDLLAKKAEKAVAQFSEKIVDKPYSNKTWLLDCLKSAVNFFKKSFNLSPEYQSRQIAKQYNTLSQKSTAMNAWSDLQNQGSPLIKTSKSPEVVVETLLLKKFEPQKSTTDVFRFSKKTLTKELDFLNKLKSLLSKDDTLSIPEKAQHLYSAMALVEKQLKSAKNLHPKDQKIIAQQMSQLQKIKSKNENSEQELERYLGQKAQAGESRALVEQCHALIVHEKLRDPTIPGPKHFDT